MVNESPQTIAVEEHGAAPLLPIPPASFPYLWFSGRRVPWEQATVHVTLVGWPAVGAVFEGIRGYLNPDDGSVAIFRLTEHMERLQTSMRLLRMHSQFSTEELSKALLELARANGASDDIYLQPLAFTAGTFWGSRAALDQAPEILITMRPTESALLSGRTLTAGVSSWARIDDTAMPPRIKALPNYLNSRLGANEAARHGYDAPIFLNQQGKVSESSGSCIFLVRNGVAITPPVTASILESITRASVIELLRDALGVTVQERAVDRTELYVASEVFLCGTAMEIAPIAEIDGFPVGTGAIGGITERLERLFHDTVRGREPRFEHWLTRV